MSDAHGYRVLERTVEVHSELDAGHVRSISELLGRELAYRSGTPAYVIDLSGLGDPEGLLGYLRGERLPHTVAEERRWEPVRR